MRIYLAHDDPVLGIVFVRQEQRILDMLCDERKFFPVSTKTGMLLLNKSSVVKLEVLEKQFMIQNQDNFPESDADLDPGSSAVLTKRRIRSTEAV